MRWCLLVLCVVVVSQGLGCSSKPTGRKPTYKVTGEVYVDGQPASELAITLNPIGPIDDKNFTLPKATVGPDGKFSVATYEEGDGAPEGEYRLTFVWGQLNKLTMQFDGDKLKGKYLDANNSQHPVKVEKDKPVDLGRINLTSS